MKKPLLLFVLMGTMCFFAIQNYLHPQVKYNDGWTRLKHPFDTRVRYRVGTIDSRFGVTENEVKSLSRQAEKIWADGTGQEWFVYDDKARLTINFIYDERQAESTARADTKFAIDGMVQSHEQQSSKLRSDREALDQEFINLQSELKHWQTRFHNVQNLMAQTQDSTQYAALNAERQALLYQKQTLDSKVAQYEQSQAKFNSSVNNFNENTRQMNSVIEDANKRFTPKEFHKGIFNGREINIYEFSSRNDLLLTLAHELGHALDIDHNDDPSALMYAYSGKQDMSHFKLKPADVQLLHDRHK